MSCDNRKIRNYLIIAFARYPIMCNISCTLFLRTGLECHMCMMIVTICTGLLTTLMWRPFKFTVGGGCGAYCPCARSWAEPAHLLRFWIRCDCCSWTSLRPELTKLCRFFNPTRNSLYQTGRSTSLNYCYSVQTKPFKFTCITFFLLLLHCCCWCSICISQSLSLQWSASSSVTHALYLPCNIRDDLNFDPSLSWFICIN